ncbi:hypothetical protein Dimus_008797 [Dionaea muscipula]
MPSLEDKARTTSDSSKATKSKHKELAKIMNSPWGVKELASDACSSSCCPNPLVGLQRPIIDHSFKSVDDSTTFQYHFATSTKTSLYPYTQFTNHESLPNLTEAFRSFVKAHPQYLQTVEADQIRAQEYHHLSVSGHVCLDYVGHGLFSYAQAQAQHQAPEDKASVASSSWMPLPLPQGPPFFDICCKSVSLNAEIILDDGGQVSESGFDFESKVKGRIMRFLKISEEDYSIVFTANQTLAFRLVAEAYPFLQDNTNRDLLTVYDHENEAAEAMIMCLKRKGVRAMSAEFKWPKLKLCYRKLKEMVAGNKNKNKNKKNKNKNKNRGLFVFPLQSRVTGARYSYQWMTMARENGWHVLLDMSALAPKDMDTLGLSLFRPDFLVCTCYKVFGNDPSGFGCLFIKKSMAATLNDLSIASSTGIVTLIPAASPSQSHPPEQPQKLQDDASSTPPSSSSTGAFRRTHSGPSNYSEIQPSCSEIEEAETRVDSTETKVTQISSMDSILGLEFRGMDHADSLGLMMINNRARCLINWLVNALLLLKHPNSQYGHPLIRIYGPKIRFDRAPALAFNVFDWKSDKIDPALVQKLADRHNISLGCGIIKNVWFSDKYKQGEEIMMKKTGKDSNLDCGIHVVTANLGFLTNFEDVYRVWVFAARFLDADFVEKERWRYMTLNQMLIEV